MKRSLFAPVWALATCVFAVSPATAAIIVSGIGSTSGIAAENDFAADLAALGLTGFTDNYGSVSITGPSTLSLYRVAAESDFTNGVDFGSGPIAEQNDAWDPSDLIGTAQVGSGSLSNQISFLSNGGGAPFTFNSAALGIFLPTAFSGSSYTADSLFVGYDDNTANPDSDHDDYVLRISASPIPEPATWAMVIGGFGLVGSAIRRRRKGAKLASA